MEKSIDALCWLVDRGSVLVPRRDVWRRIIDGVNVMKVVTLVSGAFTG